MKKQIETLIETFREWLIINEWEMDVGFYSAQEWIKRGEDVLEGAEVVLTIDNGLASTLYNGSPDLEEELQLLAEGFGYYFEFGHIWNIGFYPIEDFEPLPPPNSTYSDKLKDKRWKTKRNRIINRCNGTCEDCGAHHVKLEVHHCYYRFGREPWQYPDGALLALCRSCHELRAKEELKFRGFIPNLKTAELAAVRGAIDKGLYWFDRDIFVKFLNSIGGDEKKIGATFVEMIKTHGHPEDRVETQ